MNLIPEFHPIAGVAIALAAFCATAPFAANADATRIRHLAETYLRSDGTQIIDTGYIASTNMRVEVEFTPEHAEFTSYTDYLWGSFASGMRYGTYVQCNNASSRNGVIAFASGADGNTGWHGDDKPATRSRFKTVFDYPNKTMETWSGDAKIFTGTTKDPGFESAGTSVVLFGSRTGSSTSPSFKGRVYSFKIYDKGILVRDLVPYGRGTVTGMLDRCSSKVFAKTRGNPFVLGTDDGSVRSHRTWANGQLVDTGYCMTPQTKIEFDFAFADPTASWSCAFGALKGAGLACGFGISSGDFQWNFANGDGDSTWVRTGFARDAARHTITLDGPNSTVTLKGEDGTVQYSATITSTRTNTSDVPLRLFSAVKKENGTVSADGATSVRIYGMKIWNGGTLVRNYEPRIMDNVEGLYDTVNGTFATPTLSLTSDNYNARLTAGGDIACAAAHGTAAANADAYLESMGGSAAVNTDVTLTRSSRIESDLALNYLYGTMNLYGTSVNYLYFQRNNGERTLAMGNYWANAGTTAAELGRYRHDIDFNTGRLECTRPDGTTATSTLNATKLNNNMPSATKLALMASSTSSGSAAYMRLYGFKLYEDGALTHDYVPCVQNGVAGLWDTVDRVFYANCRSADGSGFTLGGAGANGGGMVFTEHPQSGRVSEGRSLTLTAFAPGAMGYQWLKNGEVVEGATGQTLVVPWARGAATDTYQCVSHYNLFGYGLSSVAQVENLPSGTVIYMR